MAWRAVSVRHLWCLVHVGALAATAVAGALASGAASAAESSCADVDVVVARGTYEGGTLGSRVGDPFFAAVVAALPGRSVTSHRVAYPASAFIASAAIGNQDVVFHVDAVAARCPAEKFILMGFSQGANVIGNAIGTSSAGALTGAPITAVIGAQAQPRVAAVVLFGYPNGHRGITITGTYATRTDDICAPADLICNPNGTDPHAHGRYGVDGLVAQGAAFAAARV